MRNLSTPTVGLHYSVPRLREGWELSEEKMPESIVHDQAVELLKALLAMWAARVGSALVARNLAVRWDEAHPGVGIDPDVAVFSPPPRGGQDLRSVRTWLEGQHAPLLGIEVVSETNPRKDYAIAPDKYAASGAQELWIFDPLLSGPSVHGGPYRLQIWHRREDGDFVRVFAGEGPARSPVLGAYAVVVDEGRKLRIADDVGATSFWRTAEEAEREAKEAEREAKEAEREAKEAALARIAELEARLSGRGSEG